MTMDIDVNTEMNPNPIKSQETNPTITVTTTSTLNEKQNDTEITDHETKEENDNKENKDNDKDKTQTQKPTSSPASKPTTPQNTKKYHKITNSDTEIITASLSTLPPSIDDEDNQRYHPLEFVFLIILECCREHTPIKSKKKSKTNKNKTSIKAKFDQIRQSGCSLMHHSLVQLLNGFTGPRNPGIQLCMMYLSKNLLIKQYQC